MNQVYVEKNYQVRHKQEILLLNLCTLAFFHNF